MILSDNWIRQQCQQPEYAVIENSVSNRVLGVFKTAETDLQMYLMERYDRGTPPESMFDPYIRKLTELELSEWEPMISPFHAEAIRKDENDKGIVSKGLSSYGYDVTLSNDFKLFNNLHPVLIDPKNFDENCYRDVVGDHIIIPPNSFALARTVEEFKIPRSVLAICVSKSTIARAGATVTITPLEPEWEGNLTLEIANTTNLPIKISANEGIAQLLFIRSEADCDVSYGDRAGKYQNQAHQVTTPKI